ncbi:MAG: branched-chain amino acid ABC transporter permease [bacterium]|nr:branched-chain amino acid ABC transporter permease [bacterium]
MTAKWAPRTGAPRTGVDRFLTVLRVVAVGLVLVGLGAFIAQEIDTDNAFARWANPDATGLTGAQFRGLVVSGIAQGAMYGLIALGYSMVYGVLGFINFAHGEVFMMGAMTGMITSNKLADAGLWGSNFVGALAITMLGSILVSMFLAVVMERVAYRPLRGAPRLIPLITSIGVSFFIQNMSIVLFGPASKSYPRRPDWLREKHTFLEIEGAKIMVIVAAAVSMAVLWYLVERTKVGKAMRAVAEDAEIAALMGIDVNRTIVKVFAVGGAFAGMAGILWGVLFGSVIHNTGFLPGIKAFSAAVVGGIGNLGGAMVGGLFIGIAESVGPLLILEPLGVSGVSQLRDAVAFAMLIGVLLLRPSGIFGERLRAEDRT